jgi:thiol-disulfide isomerase/thioredoxin
MNKKSISLLKTLLFLPFFVLMLFGYYEVKKWRQQSRSKEMNQQLGRPFELPGLSDINGSQAQPDFSKANVTIVDFWFKNCPDCIEEMEQFEAVLKGREDDVAIVSISIDNIETWREVLQGQNQRLAFIAKPVTNWKHLVMQPADGEGYTSNGTVLSERFGINSYPSFFAVNRDGKIIAAPDSAVSYIRTGVENKNGFLSFLTSSGTWTSLKIILLLIGSVILYSWICKWAISRATSR